MEEAQECGRLGVMADGRAVAEGTAAEIIGGRRVVAVQAATWSAAFNALESAGLQVALAGRGLRVPGSDPAAVRRGLGDNPAAVRGGPAPLEKRLFELTPQAAAGEAAGGSGSRPPCGGRPPRGA